jgi:hypothetical protein
LTREQPFSFRYSRTYVGVTADMSRNSLKP